jgi:hypothetical protein
MDRCGSAPITKYHGAAVLNINNSSVGFSLFSRQAELLASIKRFLLFDIFLPLLDACYSLIFCGINRRAIWQENGMIEILSAFGLSAATGLNAYLPLLIVGLLGRFTDWITLESPWNALENTWVLVAVAVLLLIETIVDKIPAVDTINDIIQTLIRPAAGAILFAAHNNMIAELSPVVAMICGLLVAGGMHALKATARPIITASTAGVGNPAVSVLEDIVSGISAFMAIVLPVLAAVIIAAIFGLLIWWRMRRIRRRAASA